MKYSKMIGPLVAGVLGGVVVRFALKTFTMIVAGFADGVQDQLERLWGQPWAAWWLWALAGAGIGVVYGYRQVRQHQQLREWAQNCGFELCEDPKAGQLSRVSGLDAFSNWSNVENLLTGDVDGITVQMVDFTSVHRGSESSHSETRTIVYLSVAAEGLPQFELHPRRLGIQLTEAVGARCIRFPPSETLNARDAEVISRFERRFALFPAGIRETMTTGFGVPDDWESVVTSLQQLFTADVLEFFAERPGWSIESQDGILAVWKSGTVIHAGERQALLELILSIRRVLTDELKKPSSGALELSFRPPEPGAVMTAAIRFAACLFAGFFSGGLLGGIGFMTLDAEFMFMGIAAVVSAFLGAAAGAIAGWKLARDDAGLRTLPFLLPVVGVAYLSVLGIMWLGVASADQWLSSWTDGDDNLDDLPLAAETVADTKVADTDAGLSAEERNPPVIPMPAERKPAAGERAERPDRVRRSGRKPVVAPDDDGILSIDPDHDLTWVAAGFPMGLAPTQTAGTGFSPEPLERLVAEPEYPLGQVLYGSLSLGNGQDSVYSFAAIAKPDAPWVLFFDANNNEDLTDDGGPLRYKGTAHFGGLIRLDLDVVTVTGEQRKRPCQLWFFVNKREIPLFYPRCHYRGQVSAGGMTWTAIMVDRRTHDGLYREEGLWLDLNQDDQLDADTEHFEHGDSIDLGGRQYVLRLNTP